MTGNEPRNRHYCLFPSTLLLMKLAFTEMTTQQACPQPDTRLSPCTHVVTPFSSYLIQTTVQAAFGQLLLVTFGLCVSLDANVHSGS